MYGSAITIRPLSRVRLSEMGRLQDARRTETAKDSVARGTSTAAAHVRFGCRPRGRGPQLDRPLGGGIDAAGPASMDPGLSATRGPERACGQPPDSAIAQRRQPPACGFAWLMRGNLHPGRSGSSRGPGFPPAGAVPCRSMTDPGEARACRARRLEPASPTAGTSGQRPTTPALDGGPGRRADGIPAVASIPRRSPGRARTSWPR